MMKAAIPVWRWVAVAAATCMITTPALADCPPSPSLDGKFKANDGGSYQLRSQGATVWWIGRSADNGASWTNVFKGSRKGSIITGSWADVGEGASGAGVLTLRVTANNQLQRLSGSGFAGSIWLRPGCSFSKAVPID